MGCTESSSKEVTIQPTEENTTTVDEKNSKMLKTPKETTYDYGTVAKTIEKAFPDAVTSADLVSKVKQILSEKGYEENTTLVATSLCCDEVNREFESDLVKAYSQNFSMGGLAGFAFGGVTSFGAMAHHIPDGGNCLVVYGPHVGIDTDGNIGKVNRSGRGASGACCGSAAAAAGYVKSCMADESKKKGFPDDIVDAQQTCVGNMLLQHGKRLENAADPAVELPSALFDAQDELMKKIVSQACQETHGGKITLLGGIQINTPPGMKEYFLPKVFEIRDDKNNLIKNLMKDMSVESKVTKTLKENFPNAVTSADLVSKVKQILSEKGYEENTTLVATSLCCDEVNREFESDLVKAYSQNFSMGGLAGFAFGGVTSFGAMAHHIPDGGNCLVVYGPHVGIDTDGNIGKVNRSGRGASGACCGSAAAAAGYVKSCMADESKKKGFPDDIVDAQQTCVGNMLLQHGKRLENAADPAVELPSALFDAQDELMKKIVSQACQETHGGKITLLGGIQINTPPGMKEYFLPKVFEIRDDKNNLITSLTNLL